MSSLVTVEIELKSNLREFDNSPNKGVFMKSFAIMFVVLCAAFVANAYPGSPTESFRQTCDVVREDYRRIQAYCEDGNGGMVYNDYTRVACQGDISNHYGRIVCTDDANLPQGSYQLSCNSCQVQYPIMKCRCQDTRGYYRSTSINISRCRNEISNMNGRLVCQ